MLLLAQELLNEETTQQLRETMRALQGTLRAAQRTMEVYGNPTKGPTAELTPTLAALQGVGVRLDSTLANPALARAITRSDTLTANLSKMTTQFASTGARLDSVLARVNQGEGTLGKFAPIAGCTTTCATVAVHEEADRRAVEEPRQDPGYGKDLLGTA